jgi:hypothetical protein
MILNRRHLAATLALLIVWGIVPVTAQPQAATGTHRRYLPIMFGPSLPHSPFGFDMRANMSDAVIAYTNYTPRPQWSRAGDILWSDVEAQRGTYNWAKLAMIEANIRRLRAAGIEPTIVVQRSPSWAQREPGRLCSPPKPEYLPDFARFMAALAARYADGPLAVKYWEVWNEPDFAANEVRDEQGFGCWANPSLPYHGGVYYGEALKHVYPAVKRANPNAKVIGGALMYFWPDDTVSRSFLEGMLVAGAGNFFDALSFHAYGDWGVGDPKAGDMLIGKATRIRALLQKYGLATKPIFATEIGVLCLQKPCPQSFQALQANYTARIYAEAIALDLMGALWYTLVTNHPEAVYSSHLIDDRNGTLTPRPAYFAFRNSAILLQDARYTGPPLQEPPPDKIDDVQLLKFRKTSSTLYVLWVPDIQAPNNFPPVEHALKVAPGAVAICTNHLDWSTPTTYYCSDTNKDGTIWLAVGELPQYICLPEGDVRECTAQAWRASALAATDDLPTAPDH